MSWKSNAAIVLTIVGLGLGAAALIDRPSTPSELEQHRRQQQVEDLSDSHERELGRYEDEAEDLRNAESDRKAIPGEPRPDLPKLNLPGKG